MIQTQEQIERLRTLQESYNAVADAVETQLPALTDKIDNIKLPEIDTTELAKEATLNAVSSKLDNLNVEVDLSGVAKQGENQEATNSKILEEVKQIPTVTIDIMRAAGMMPPINYDGILLNSGYQCRTVLEFFINIGNVTHINDDTIDIGIPNEIWSQLRTLVSIKMFSLIYLSSTAQEFTGNYYVKIINLPNLIAIRYNGQICNNGNLRELRLPKLKSITGNPFVSCTKLILLETGAEFKSNINLSYWNPTEALRSDISTLVEYEETFTNNLEKLLYNIRTYFAANLRSDVGNFTITFSAPLKAAILADQETADAFTNKGWTIA